MAKVKAKAKDKTKRKEKTKGKKEKRGLFSFSGMRIQQRLKKAFNIVTVFSAATALVGLLAIVVVTSNFKNAITNYALPQGDIALFMKEYTECRSNMRGIIGYEDMEMKAKLIDKHTVAKESTYARLADIEKTMISKEAKDAYAEIKVALDAYFEVEAKVIETGNDVNQRMGRKAQVMAQDEAAPLFEALDTATLKLMDINVAQEQEMEDMCNMMENLAVILMAILTVCIVVISRRVSAVIARGITKPLNELSGRLQEFENGDISSSFPEDNEADEIADMVKVVSSAIAKLQKIFGDLERLLHEMADGNFNIRTSCEEEYIGEYNGILMAIRQMNRKMDAALKDVRGASEMVSAGSSNLAEGAQALAEGATEQATSIHTMQAKMEDLTNGLEKCATDMVSAYNKATECAKVAAGSKVEMESMVATMERISDTSSKIESIIAEIEDIASQTNLLSLNAAIEAARAGEAGRGFAVVADQIRNLADQSAKSAINTRELIESSVYEIGVGTKAALKSAEALNGVVSSVEGIATTSKQLNEDIKLQVDSIGMATEELMRISEVVSNNSATAEQSSATSEELSAQAINMDEMVARFQLREE